MFRSTEVHINCYSLSRTITKRKIFMTIHLVMVYKSLLIQFITNKHKLPKLLPKRNDFIMICKLVLPEIIQSVLKFLPCWNITARDASMTKLGYNPLWSIVLCKAMLNY